MSDSFIDITVIICTAGRPELLAKTLASLGNVSVPDGIRGELLVVDNAPSGETRAVIKAAHCPNLKVSYLEEPRRGQTFARNTGIARSRGEYILFTDDDLEFPVDWIEQIVAPMRNGETDAVAGGVRIAPHLERSWMRTIHRVMLAQTCWPEDPQASVNMVGANMAFHRRVLAKVPGFDTNLGPGQLGFADDTFFSAQLLHNGYRITRRPEATVTHHFEPNRLQRRAFLSHVQRLGESQAYVAHHWEHRTLAMPQIHALRKRSQIALWRMRHHQAVAQPEGLDEGEIYNLIALAFYEKMAEEQKKPRAYPHPDRKPQTDLLAVYFGSKGASGLLEP